MADLSTIKVTAYLTVEGRRNSWQRSGPIRSGRVIKATFGKPGVIRRDQIVVKVALVIPLASFEPLNLTDAGMVAVPSDHILAPAFFTEAPDLEGDDGDA